MKREDYFPPHRNRDCVQRVIGVTFPHPGHPHPPFSPTPVTLNQPSTDLFRIFPLWHFHQQIGQLFGTKTKRWPKIYRDFFANFYSRSPPHRVRFRKLSALFWIKVAWSIHRALLNSFAYSLTHSLSLSRSFSLSLSLSVCTQQHKFLFYYALGQTFNGPKELSRRRGIFRSKILSNLWLPKNLQNFQTLDFVPIIFRSFWSGDKILEIFFFKNEMLEFKTSWLDDTCSFTLGKILKNSRAHLTKLGLT